MKKRLFRPDDDHFGSKHMSHTTQNSMLWSKRRPPAASEGTHKVIVKKKGCNENA